jgi:hypothetical protein
LAVFSREFAGMPFNRETARPHAANDRAEVLECALAPLPGDCESTSAENCKGDFSSKKISSSIMNVA